MNVIGRQSDGFGNLAQWWTDNTVERYLDRAKCFVKQYNSFRVPQLDEMLMKTAFVSHTIEVELLASNNTCF